MRRPRQALRPHRNFSGRAACGRPRAANAPGKSKRPSRLLCDEAVADPWDAVDVVGLLRVTLDLLAQPVDVGVDGAGLDLDLISPDLAQKLPPADNLAGLRGQQGEQVELGQGQS